MKSTHPLGTSSAFLAILVAFGLMGCASSPDPNADFDPMARENAIFACKKSMQEKKKERFASLNPLVKRMLGENQILGEFERPPTSGQIARAIARFPLEGDSGGTWGLKKDSHLRTVAARIEKLAPSEKDPEGTELLIFSFGQPGRVYPFPLFALKRQNFGRGFQGGIAGTFRTDHLEIRVIDEHHVLVTATGGLKKGSAPEESNFYPRDIYAVIRTYLEQSYTEETAAQLSDYPIFAPTLDETICDQ